jgi:hypothetical protein
MQYQSKTAKGGVMTPILYIAGSVMASAFIFVGWGGSGYLHHACSIIGGLYFGHLLTEALKGGQNDN